MATEYETLALQVNLVDNASAGLTKINEQLRQLGRGEAAQAQARVTESFRTLGNVFRGVTGEVAKLGTEFTGLGRTLASSAVPMLRAAGTAIGGIGAAVAVLLPILKQFSQSMGEISQLARETGHNAATIKIFREEMTKLFGPAGVQLADQTLRGLSKTMTDIQNPASELNLKMQELAGHDSSKAADAMRKLREELAAAARSGDVAAFYNKQMQALDNVQKNFADIVGPQAAAELRNRMAELMDIPKEVAATHRPIRSATEEEIEHMKRLLVETDRFNRALDSAGSSIGRMVGALIQAVVPFDKVTLAAKFIAEQLERAANAMEKMHGFGTSQPGAGAGAEGAGGGEAWKQFLPFWARALLGMPTGYQQWDQPGAQPQRFTSATGGASPEQAETMSLIRREIDLMGSLTGEMRRLNDYLMVLNAAEGISTASTSLSTKTPGLVDKPGGPSGTVNADLSFADFARVIPGALMPKGRERAYNAFINLSHRLGIPASELIQQLSPLHKQPGSGPKYLTGVSRGTGMASWYGNPRAGSTIYKWPTDPMDPYGKAALGGGKFFPEEKQGISLSSSATLGQFHLVTTPEGDRYKSQQTDVGPGMSTGKILDLSPPALEAMGKTPRTFQTGSLYSVAPTTVTEQERKAVFSSIQQMPATIPHMPRLMETLRVGAEAEAGGGPVGPSRPGGLGSDIGASLRSDDTMPANASLMQGMLPPGDRTTQRLNEIFDAGRFKSAPKTSEMTPEQIEWESRRPELGPRASGRANPLINENSILRFLSKGRGLDFGIDDFNPIREKLDRSLLDGAMGRQMHHSVTGTGTVDVNVGGGGDKQGGDIGYLFKPPAIDRQTNMWPTESGPRDQISPLRDNLSN
jgi:hypothetical protein